MKSRTSYTLSEELRGHHGYRDAAPSHEDFDQVTTHDF
jgi:hypothetical protein